MSKARSEAETLAREGRERGARRRGRTREEGVREGGSRASRWLRVRQHIKSLVGKMTVRNNTVKKHG